MPTLYRRILLHEPGLTSYYDPLYGCVCVGLITRGINERSASSMCVPSEIGIIGLKSGGKPIGDPYGKDLSFLSRRNFTSQQIYVTFQGFYFFKKNKIHVYCIK